jgi:superfamily II DNA or RNA helicase
MPISWRGTLAQYAGRLHRLHAAKRQVIIFDYVDGHEPMLAKMATRREAGYRDLRRRKSLQYQNSAPARPKDSTRPQSPEDKQGAGYRNEVPTSSWLRGGGESAEGKPSYGKIKPRQ